ncbi:FecCD family ABC transporter permease [Rhizorhabdus dicambivorans]|uniref:Iron ABC transporter permease n=1 Tax=Rhizorhabdus dicambivorans TaxID=1850238 RepID=A0A2A4FU67_9SPHN|nr:iron ABC transporter permease [Rhizorhabdus dicambivorans]ATE65358.1 iron ABC transporter permease [Rhizorhabdus dicambivorans]PCE42312.1 iron ABC transporter permease [Rhizorhabdus dicambivorans]
MTFRSPRLLLIALLALAALLLGVGSLLTGPTRFGSGEIAHILAGGGDPVLRAVLLELRLPRALLGLLVGAMLGLGGAVLQGYLRNPLAEPSVLGTSNAAALGAVVALYYGLSQAHPLALPLLAITGALLGLAPLLLLAGRAESPLSLILAGIAVGTLAGAGISLALNLAPNPFAAMEIMSWLMGSLEDRSFDHILLALPCIAVGAALLLWNARALDALTLGEEAAQTLGVNLGHLRLRLLVATAIGVGGAVAVSGAVGFVGLIVPHLLRPLTDRSPSALLIPSALGGAALLSAADIAVRLIPTEIELRLGVLTALLGVPVFLYHLVRERRLW